MKMNFKKNTYIWILVIFGLMTIVIMTGCINDAKKNGDIAKQTPQGIIVTPISQGTSGRAVSSSTSYILEKYDLKKLVSMSDNIIIGDVSNVLPSKWNTPDGKRPSENNNTPPYIIYTDTNIKIVENLKGSLNSTIIVRTLGGTVGQDTQNVEDQPSYNINEKVLIFLKKDNDPRTQDIGDDHFITVGLVQGKIPISQNNDVIIGDEKMSLDDFRIRMTE